LAVADPVRSVSLIKGNLMVESTAPRKQIILAVIVAALACFIPGPHLTTYAQDITPQTATLHRVTLIVSDIDRSMDFYRRIGLIPLSDTTRSSAETGGVISGDVLPLTDDPTRSRLVTMAGNGGASGEIALLWYDRPPLPSARGNLMGLGTGDVVIMFQVPDIQTVHNRLNSVGTRFHEPPTRFTSRTLSGAAQTGRRLMAFDPDGHMVEVTQIE
jgi:catechol 2,3-dioxygenase-like lactoylglutathione lyase family enzyme